MKYRSRFDRCDRLMRRARRLLAEYRAASSGLEELDSSLDKFTMVNIVERSTGKLRSLSNRARLVAGAIDHELRRN